MCLKYEFQSHFWFQGLLFEHMLPFEILPVIRSMLFRCWRGEGAGRDVEKYLTQLHYELSFLIYAYPLNPQKFFMSLLPPL